MIDVMNGCKFVMMEKSTGNFEVVDSIEKAYEMLQAHTHLIGYMSFADLDMINATITSCAEIEATK